MSPNGMAEMLSWQPWGMEVDLTTMPDNRIHDFIKSCCEIPAPTPPFRVKVDARVASIMLGYIDEKLQRPASPTGVAYLMSILKEGEFSETTHQGIAFTDTCKLIDAQHRMKAIIGAGDGHAPWMWCFFGLPESDFACMDLGRKRSLADAIRTQGHGDPKSIASMVLPLVFGAKCASYHIKVSPKQAIDYAAEHEDAIRFVLDIFAAKKRGVSAAINLAVVGRAYYTQDPDRLRTFAHFLYELAETRPPRNYNPDTDSAVAVFARWISDGVPKGGTGRREHYGKMQSALHSFVNHRPLTKLYGTFDRELFPIPQDEQQPLVLDS